MQKQEMLFTLELTQEKNLIKIILHGDIGLPKKGGSLLQMLHLVKLEVIGQIAQVFHRLINVDGELWHLT